MKTIQIKIVNDFLKGKFYFRKEEIDYNLLPDKVPVKIKMFIGKDSQEAKYSTLIDSGKGYKRINNVKLKIWFEDEKLSVGDYFKVDIIDEVTYRVYK